MHPNRHLSPPNWLFMFLHIRRKKIDIKILKLHRHSEWTEEYHNEMGHRVGAMSNTQNALGLQRAWYISQSNNLADDTDAQHPSGTQFMVADGLNLLLSGVTLKYSQLAGGKKWIIKLYNQAGRNKSPTNTVAILCIPAQCSAWVAVLNEYHKYSR